MFSPGCPILSLVYIKKVYICDIDLYFRIEGSLSINISTTDPV